MTPDLSATAAAWLPDPLTLRLAVVAAGLVLITLLTSLLRRTLSHHVSDNATRYQARKAVSLLGTLVALLFLAVVFSDHLGGLTLAFGVAGAGIAFALQEVIASAAGWVAVSFGGFYKVGDRVQLGGIKGDVIDIGMPRTTVMAIDQRAQGDQYNGRILRVANSFVFKEPVFNGAGELPFLGDQIMRPVKYGSDHRLAPALIERVAQAVVGDHARAAEQAWPPVTRRDLIEKASVAPTVTRVANQNGLAFSLRYGVDCKVRRATRDRLFTAVLEAIDQVTEWVGIAASTLNIEKLAPLEVHLRRASAGAPAAAGGVWP